MTDVLSANQKLLDAISNRDWDGYVSLCDPELTCFEPEACGNLVEGLEFHKFYFGGSERKLRSQSTMVSPRVALLSEHVALLTYLRILQTVDSGGTHESEAFEETRVWRNAGAGWKLFHFHRSAA